MRKGRRLWRLRGRVTEGKSGRVKGGKRGKVIVAKVGGVGG